MAKNQPILIDIGQGLSLSIGLPTIATWTTSERPKNPRRGTLGFNIDTKSLEYNDGSDWLVAQMDNS